VHVLIGNQPVAFFDRELEHELRSFPSSHRYALHGRRLRLVFSREWLESREEVAHERSLEVETRGSPREFRRRNYCWGEPVTRTHVPTGKISGW
jgi:hypothetical protein